MKSLKVLFFATFLLGILHLLPGWDVPWIAAGSGLLWFTLLPALGLLSLRQMPVRLIHFAVFPVLSMPIVTTVFVLLRAANLSADYSRMIITTIVATVPAILVLTRRCPSVRLCRLDWWIVAVALVTSLTLAVLLSADGVLASWHGFFHSSVTEQIISQGVPPPNPAFPGESLNFYWAWHALIALLATAARVHPLYSIAALNSLLLGLVIVISYELAKPFFYRRSERVLVVFALFGAINTAAGLILLLKYVRYGTIPGSAWSNGHFIDWLGQRSIPFMIWDGRLSSFIKEFFDISGMATGLTLLVVYFAIWSDWRRHAERWWLVEMVLTLYALTAFYPPLAILALVHYPIACWLSWRFEGYAQRSLKPLLWRLIIPVLPLLLLIPYVLSVTNKSGWAEHGEPFLILGQVHRQLLPAFGPYFALTPLMLPGVLLWWRKRRRLSVAIALSGLGVVSFFAVGVQVADHGEYKFVYSLSLFAALLAIEGWRWWLQRLKLPPTTRRWAMAGLALVLLNSPVIFIVGALQSQMYEPSAVTVVGRNLVLQNEPERMECLTWMRDYTPDDAIVVLPLIENHKSPSNIGFQTPALLRRGAYLVYDVYHSRRYRRFSERVATVEKLLNHSDPAGAAAEIAKNLPGSPVYALVHHTTVPPKYPGWSVEYRCGAFTVLTLEEFASLVP